MTPKYRCRSGPRTSAEMKVLDADQPMLCESPMSTAPSTATGNEVAKAIATAPRLWATPALMSIHRAPSRSVRLPIGPAASAATRASRAMIVPAASREKCRTSCR